MTNIIILVGNNSQSLGPIYLKYTWDDRITCTWRINLNETLDTLFSKKIYILYINCKNLLFHQNKKRERCKQKLTHINLPFWCLNAFVLLFRIMLYLSSALIIFYLSSDVTYL